MPDVANASNLTNGVTFLLLEDMQNKKQPTLMVMFCMVGCRYNYSAKEHVGSNPPRNSTWI